MRGEGGKGSEKDWGGSYKESLLMSIPCHIILKCCLKLFMMSERRGREG